MINTAILAAFLTTAIITRHDTGDEKYIALAGTLPDGSLVDMGLRTPRGYIEGAGTLIADRWVITAAHVAEGIEPGHEMTIGDQVVEVADVTLHPEFKPRNPMHDMGLIELAEPVVGVEPVPLMLDAVDVGTIVLFGGRGDHGTGETGPTGNDLELRAALNSVQEVTELHLVLKFDAPDSEDALELEGVPGPGDSGNAGLVEVDGVYHIAGVSSGQSTRGTDGPGHYGVRDYFVRIDAQADWIEKVTGLDLGSTDD